MGILKRNVSAKSGRSAVTIIAEGNRFQGETSISGKMHLDGQFEGSIDCSGDISVGRTGVMRGRVRAHAVNISGVLEGELICESLHIERGGKVHANVYCTTLSIDPEGCFIGERKLLGQERLTWDGSVTQRIEHDDELEVVDGETNLIDSLPDRITLSGNS